MNIREFFKRVGGDYELTVQRLLSEKLLVKYIRKFADEPSYGQLKSAIAVGDVPTAFRAAHTLKGSASSLGLGDLTAAASALTEELRGAASLPDDAFVAAVDAAYSSVTGMIPLIDEF